MKLTEKCRCTASISIEGESFGDIHTFHKVWLDLHEAHMKDYDPEQEPDSETATNVVGIVHDNMDQSTPFHSRCTCGWGGSYTSLSLAEDQGEAHIREQHGVGEVQSSRRTVRI